MYIKRSLDLKLLLRKKSHFLFGPRGTGKTSLVKETLLAKTAFIDLLDDDIYSRLLRRPKTLAEFILPGKSTVVVDEIQRIPELLNEVHRLIETRKLQFLLTGSSARKLRRGGANLLGGRAWEANLFPLTSLELGTHFSLERYLNHGGLPTAYFSKFAQEELRNYIKLYIKEEIQAEAIVRRMDHFVRFLDVIALQSGAELNYEGIGSDAGVPSRTVANFFEVLEDTLIGFSLPSFTKTKKRKAIKRSKFYVFDVGVAGSLAERGPISEKSEAFGKAFEHFIIQEVRAMLSYTHSIQGLTYWRSTTQQEVDLIVGTQAAIEIKSTERITDRHLSGLTALKEEKLIAKYFIVSRDPIARTINGIQCLPLKDFLKLLWTGKIA